MGRGLFSHLIIVVLFSIEYSLIKCFQFDLSAKLVFSSKNFSYFSNIFLSLYSETCDETGKYTQSMENVNYYYDVFGNSHEDLQGSIVAEFCGGSASVARGFVTHKVYLNNSQSTGDYSPPSCDDESVVVDSKDSPATECNDTELRM